MVVVQHKVTAIIKNMITPIDPSLLRLLHLVSPSLPIGAFTYSQGLEWAVECDWVKNEAQLLEWIGHLLENSLAQLEIPLLARLYQARDTQDKQAFKDWTYYLLASRETQELRQEERNRGRALASLLPELGIPISTDILPVLKSCQLSGFVYAAQYWHIPLSIAAAGYLWSWLEAIVLAGVKIIPLGQSAGQRILANLSPNIPEIVKCGLQLTDDKIGASCPAQILASSLHETQYTRIYRS